MFAKRLSPIAVVTAVLLASPVFAAPSPTPVSSTAPAVPKTQGAAVPQPVVSPLSDAQLKDPVAALAASRKLVGADAWKKVGAIYVAGFVQTQNQSLPFTYVADLKTGYCRTIILLPHNAGTYEFGVDKDGGWNAVNDRLRPFDVPAQNLKAALYVNRFGFFNYPSDAAALKEVGVDPKIGDRITVTPAGAAPILAILKPSTALVSAIQFASGQVTVYADYRPIAGVLYPYRVMQGTDANALSVFQASNVELTAAEPDAAPISRPALPIDTSTPQPAGGDASATKPPAH
jgi:hypothetical protein